MKNTYFDLIEQSYYFPQEGFDLRDNSLTFHGVSLKHLIEKHGTPFRFIYLPKIGDQIKKARNLFNRVIKNNAYKGEYNFCYCTKCNHFYHVVNEAIKHNVNLETSSSFDIDLILSLYQKGKITTDIKIIHNGYKTEEYLRKIVDLQKAGFHNSVIILDSINEYHRLARIKTKHVVKIGVRMSINEEAQSAYYTSRLGIPQKDILEFYRTYIHDNPKVEFKMFHFFVDSGIKDTPYYWGEFRRALSLYIDLKKESASLDSLNMGGGFPIRNSLGFEYNYEYMINEIVGTIKSACADSNIPEPHLFTEYGKYTVGEAGAIIFEVLDKKQQNDNETWYIIDNSLMNTIPDAWSIQEKFILLPVNKWNHEYGRVNIGGISCDHSDYYNSDDLNQEVLLPQFDKEKDKEPLYLGFFHTGAYQDSVSGYGGIKHCLIPAPKHVIIDRDDKGNIIDTVYREEQSVAEMFKILGYNE
ncbi:arginine decarboxylase [Flammeovirga sp. SubArs3]|uniref:arginine decarboxylase n=1 Tax=Flammeovirga sp. SubArs3 TaxID=2995316 RepID=UPI00248ABB1B|nr:arginine decarboxylase [Flammeovirga sp. SubArs3]